MRIIYISYWGILAKTNGILDGACDPTHHYGLWRPPIAAQIYSSVHGDLST